MYNSTGLRLLFTLAERLASLASRSTLICERPIARAMRVFINQQISNRKPMATDGRVHFEGLYFILRTQGAHIANLGKVIFLRLSTIHIINTRLKTTV